MLTASCLSGLELHFLISDDAVPKFSKLQRENVTPPRAACAWGRSSMPGLSRCAWGRAHGLKTSGEGEALSHQQDPLVFRPCLQKSIHFSVTASRKH